MSSRVLMKLESGTGHAKLEDGEALAAHVLLRGRDPQRGDGLHDLSMKCGVGYFIGQIRTTERVLFPAAELFGQNVRLFLTESCRPPTPTCFVMSARSSGRTSSSTARSRSTPPSSRCASLSVYFNTNLVGTLDGRPWPAPDGSRRRGRCCRGVADLQAPERLRSGSDHGFDRDVHGAHLLAGSRSNHQPLPSEAARSATALRERPQADVHAVWSSASSEPAATPTERCVVERAAVRTGKNS